MKEQGKGFNICVFICTQDGSVFDHYMQMASKASCLAQEGGFALVVLCIGNLTKEQGRQLFSCGVDTIYVCEPNTAICDSQMVDATADFLRNMANVKLVLFPSTPVGEAVVARLSVRLQIGLTADCTEICIENGRFVYKRAALNSMVTASIVTKNCAFGMCTIKKNVFLARPLNTDRTGLIKKVPFTAVNRGTQTSNLLKRMVCKDLTGDIDKAKVVFGAGRGLSKEAIPLLQDVAVKYGASIAATRPLIEAGLFPHANQVGQSGRSITPDLYLAFGISGACQHMIGVRNAKTIVSVNIDTKAPIYQFADYTIVADAFHILKKLLEV